MAKNKAKGMHSREERLKQLANEVEDEAPSADHAGNGKLTLPEISGAGDDQPTVQATAVMAPDAYAQDGIVDGDGADQLSGLDVDAQGYPLNVAPMESGTYVTKEFAEIPQKRKRRALKAFGITAGVLIGIALIAYIAGAVVFMGRFLPNTFINEYDLSMKTDEEAVEILDGAISGYELDVVGNGFSYHTTAADIGLDIDSEGIVKGIHNDLDAWSWPLLFFQPSHDESERFVVTYMKDNLGKDVGKKVKRFNKDAKPPVNASIAFDNASDKYVVTPEEIGGQLDKKLVKTSVFEAVSNLNPALTLTTDHLLKPTVYSDDEKLIETAELASGMVSARVKLKLNGQEVTEVEGDQLSKFITINDKLKVKLNEKELANWVTELVNGYDTIGTERHYTREDGEAFTVKGGSYGWEVDTEATREALLEAIKAGETTEIDIPCISTADTYSGPGERDWGNRYIDVDISAQYVRFYGANGNIIWEADCITGAPDGKHDTWEGVWYVNNKESPSTLIGYTETGKKDYETKVTYWMPFEGNGIGFHDASWQPGFGGSMYASGYGSHGCVNLAPSDAETLYNIIEIGDVVVVHS